MTTTRTRRTRQDTFVGENINLALLPGTKAMIDEVREDDESRAAFIRVAITRELQRRGCTSAMAAAE